MGKEDLCSIAWRGPVVALMRRQLCTVPFENLDVQAGIGVSLVPEDIAGKILTHGRGGYCYEVNGLFAMALLALADLDLVVRQDMDSFMLSRTDNGEYLLRALAGGQWQNQYAFDLSPREWIDFAPANYLNSTHPDALFVQKRVVVLYSESGRSILAGNALKVVSADSVLETALDEAAVGQALQTRFGLTAPQRPPSDKMKQP